MTRTLTLKPHRRRRKTPDPAVAAAIAEGYRRLYVELAAQYARPLENMRRAQALVDDLMRMPV